MSESSRIWLAFAVIISILAVIAMCSLSGCADFAAYEKTVDSRSVEGYAKDNNGNAQGGVKYTVHYR